MSEYLSMSMPGNKRPDMTILIVEDSPTQAERLKYILERNGFVVATALNGMQALEYMKVSTPSLIISDIMMPVMDGYRLCFCLRADDALKDIPVILLTTFSDTRDVLNALACGADNFLLKPVDEELLLSRIEHVFKNRELRNSGRQPGQVNLIFDGQHYCIETEDYRILDLLVSTYESVIRKNMELIDARERLRSVNVQLKAEILERRQAENSLKKVNSELSVLYSVSSAISRTIDMNELFNEIIDTITALNILRLEKKCVIFVSDGDNLHMAYDFGHSIDFQKAHRTIKIGECLCGLCAKTEKIIVSSDSVTDDRHSVKTGLPSHSHVIIPLKAKGSLVGVLCLYTVPGTDNAMDETKMNLLYTLGNQIGVALDHARLYEEARTLSLRDPLTGLANRRLMDINIERCLLLAERNKTSLNVIMLDIDYFKRYNDTYGHAEGDKLLSEIGRILLNCIRTADLAVRYGGEEFLVLLPETSAGMAVEIAERIRMSVEKETIVTISLGVSSCSDGVATKENIIVAADNALYKAKANGRNRVEIG